MIIDSHIHLYAKSHLPTLTWADSSAPDALLRQNSVEQYKKASRQRKALGFVFVETDRKSDLTENGWTSALEEVAFLRRINAGEAIDGEGHLSEDRDLLLGAVIWAPLGAPVDVLEKYLRQSGAIEDLKAQDGLVRGFRYLLQDKPQGTALKDEFVDGLLFLEQVGARTFDLGVDFRQGGQWQLEESVSMLERFSSRSTGQMKFVINHFCKPNLVLSGDEAVIAFNKWKTSIERLAGFRTYMKMSGFFSELPPQEVDSPASIPSLVEKVRPYVEVIFANFGSSRIMFGSDWPVCNVGGPGPDASWQHWVALVDAILEDQELTENDKSSVWAGCAQQVYDLQIQ